MKSQGMQENQDVTFMSDGADTVRNLQRYLHPSSGHLLDWFYVTMRVTVLKQQAKSVKPDDAGPSDDSAKNLERAKHFLWHGNVERALETLDSLAFDLEVRRSKAATIAKLHHAVIDFDAYIRNDREYIPNYGERYRQGDTITTSFVESTINQVVTKRFVKKQQMQWTPRGAHLLLQTRTRVLDDELETDFRGWYPGFRPETAAPPAFGCSSLTSAQAISSVVAVNSRCDSAGVGFSGSRG